MSLLTLKEVGNMMVLKMLILSAVTMGHPLYALVARDETAEMVKLIQMQSGHAK